MTKEERDSCINTVNTLRRLALNIHGVIDVIDSENCDKIINMLKQTTEDRPQGCKDCPYHINPDYTRCKECEKGE